MQPMFDFMLIHPILTCYLRIKAIVEVAPMLDILTSDAVSKFCRQNENINHSFVKLEQRK
eukprot:scaffold106424_cov29-Prasinocladus_malaysianus.AAC.1